MACHYRLLDQLDSSIRKRLLEGHREIDVDDNHQLLFQADWGDEAYVVSAGILKARCLSVNGEEVVIALMGVGALIGELALLSPKPIRSVDVVALTPAKLLKLRKNALQREMEESPSLMKAIAVLQAQRLTALGDRLMLMKEDATTRLLATLLHLALLNGAQPCPTNEIPALLQQEIATLAGLSRSTASTLINKMVDNGTLVKSSTGMVFASLDPLKKRGLLAGL
jgi:CRP/FNR family cyclic AMP-dependent transcriptional regulator